MKYYKISGIYKITSLCKPYRIYIGSASDIQRRWNTHICKLRSNKHVNKKLQNHYNKYGESDLQFSILLGCNKEDLTQIEQYFLDSCIHYFNICDKAANTLGYKHTEESKQKMRKPKSDIAKINYSIAARGRTTPPNRKAVLQYDRNMNLIREFDSGKDAALTLGISKSNICSVLKHNKKTAGGYIWVYKNKI